MSIITRRHSAGLAGLAGTAALVLTTAACGGSTPAPAPAATPTSASASSTSSASSTAATSTTTSTMAASTTSAPSSTSAAASTSVAVGGNGSVAVDQATPEGAAKTFLTATGDADAKAMCSVVANSAGKTVAAAGVMDQCVSQMGTLATQIGPSLKPYLSGLTITGAKVTGDTASFKDAKVTPQAAQQALSTFTGKQIGGKWYIVAG